MATGDRGFGLVEMMVGTVLVTIASLSLVSVITNMAAQNAKAQTQSRALALQTEIIAAITRAQTFSGTTQLSSIQSTTRQTTGGAGTAAVDGLTLVTTAGKTIAVSGQRIGLDMNFDSCDPTQTQCPFRVDLSLRCSAPAGCSAAYRVSVASDATKFATAAFGAPLRTAAASVPGDAAGDRSHP